MPLYEYRCRSCTKRFELLVWASSRPTCPHCESKNLDKLLSVFAVSTGSGRPASRESAGSCGSCGDPRGPGSCSTN